MLIKYSGQSGLVRDSFSIPKTSSSPKEPPDLFSDDFLATGQPLNVFARSIIGFDRTMYRHKIVSSHGGLSPHENAHLRSVSHNLIAIVLLP